MLKTGSRITKAARSEGLESCDAGLMVHGHMVSLVRSVFPPSVYFRSVFNRPSHVCRLVHQDGSLADLTMLSASSVEATPTRDEQDPQEEHGEWGAEPKEQPLVVIPTADVVGEKTRTFSEQHQSSADESFNCSAGSEPEPSTEQSSGNQHADIHGYNSISSAFELICCIQSFLIILTVTKMLSVHFYSP